MSIRSRMRTGRTLWRVYRHRRIGHALIVDPGAVTCQTCSRTPEPLPCLMNGCKANAVLGGWCEEHQ